MKNSASGRTLHGFPRMYPQRIHHVIERISYRYGIKADFRSHGDGYRSDTRGIQGACTDSMQDKILLIACKLKNGVR